MSGPAPRPLMEGETCAACDEPATGWAEGLDRAPLGCCSEECRQIIAIVVEARAQGRTGQA